MANLLLTTECQRKCVYCFANEDKNKHMVMDWENFMTAVGFVATGPKALTLLGGEPTLHPNFDNMLAYLLENDFIVQVFTNGMVKQDMLDKITDVLNRITLREQQLLFGININEAKYRTEEEDRLQKRFLKNMGHLVHPCFTIHEKTSLIFLHEYVKKYYLDPTVRIGLAMPVCRTRGNKYLPISQYRQVAENIIELAENSDGTSIIFDCGFPLCMFKLEELGELMKNKENLFSFDCGVPLDIYPDLSMTNCYPLSKMHVTNLHNFSKIEDAYKYFEEGFASPEGIYGSRCTTCQFFGKACTGGCKGFADRVADE